MKKFFEFVKCILLLATFFIRSTSLQAQIELKEGILTYEMTEIKVENEELKQMMDMMRGSQMRISFNSKIQKTDMDMMGGMVRMQTFNDIKKKSSTMLVDMMGQKFKILIDVEQQKKLDEDRSKSTPPAIKIFDNETKEILGYQCKKVILSIAEGNENMAMQMYVTDKIKTAATFIRETRNIDIGGVPLAYEITAGEIKMFWEVKKIDRNVDKNEFNIPKEGYEVMTMEEYLQKMGGMDGLGF